MVLDYGYPKKKRKKKMACQRSMTQKKREKERGVTMSGKKMRERKEGDDTRERTNASRRNTTSHPLIHTLTPFDRDCMTCFSMDPLFDFKIYEMQVCLVLTLP